MINLFSLATLAAETINLQPPSGNQFASLGSLKAGDIVSALARIFIVVAAVVFFFYLVIGGIRWIMSSGDKAATEAARNQITAALIGLVIVFAAWAIIQLISVFFGGINLFNLTIPSVTGQ